MYVDTPSIGIWVPYTPRITSIKQIIDFLNYLVQSSQNIYCLSAVPNAGGYVAHKMVWLDTYNAKTAIFWESSLNVMAGCPSSLCCRHSSMHGISFVLWMFYEQSIPINCAISVLRNNRMQPYFHVFRSPKHNHEFSPGTNQTLNLKFHFFPRVCFYIR